MSETLKQRLTAAADAIDDRLGPITGAAADRLAPLLREAARATSLPADSFHGRAEQLLATATPTDTVVLAIITADHALVCQVKHAGRPRDLVDLAASLLEQAADIIDEDDAPSEETSTLRDQISNAALSLPNRFDEEGDDGP